jgi:outer membrane protein W
MRNQYTFLVVFLSSLLTVKFTNAQTYKRFKVDVTTGYANPTGQVGDISGGLNFSIEPKYNITDQIAVGIKREAALLIAGSSNGGDGKIALLQSTSLTGEYYYGEGKVRPFGGIGLGFYAGTTFDSDGNSSTGESVFGFAPRAGLQFSHFRLGVEYNIIKDSNYFAIKIGATIGGGRKD